MQLKIYNIIQMEDDTEIIEEIHDCQWTSKGDYDYLVHQNDHDEKVVIKFNSQELTMTRFSQPKSIIHFVKNEDNLASIPTSMGVQSLVTRTKSFVFEKEARRLHLGYDLLTDSEAKIPLASYKMQISWS